MRIYRELFFRGNESQLSGFVERIGEFANGDWEQRTNEDCMKDYLSFDYSGDEVERSQVSIHVGNKLCEGEIKVVNIVPFDKSNLSIDEYNAILLKFYEDVIKPYKETGTDVIIEQPTDDAFDPLMMISREALDKLELFCGAANKSTGSSHPLDKERWLDFICQTVDDDMMFDYSTLASFLQDEKYWGSKDDDFIGVMGNFAWSEEKAIELASEYDNLVNILQYYKKTRG